MPRRRTLSYASVSQLTSILKVGHQWNLPGVKQFAIDKLQKIPDTELEAFARITLYKKYNVDRRNLEQAYLSLVVRPEPLTFEEGELVGEGVAIAIADARERVRDGAIMVGEEELAQITGQMVAGLHHL